VVVVDTIPLLERLEQTAPAVVVAVAVIQTAHGIYLVLVVMALLSLDMRFKENYNE
jgi:hypothetical protein